MGNLRRRIEALERRLEALEESRSLETADDLDDPLPDDEDAGIDDVAVSLCSPSSVPCPNCGATLVLFAGTCPCWRCLECGNSEAVGIAPTPSPPIDLALPRRFKWTAPDGSGVWYFGTYFPRTRRFVNEAGVTLWISVLKGLEWIDPEPREVSKP
jgi:hypothetical protein